MILNKPHFKTLIKNATPHGFVAHRVASLQVCRLQKFYEEQLGIRRGQLVFDVGANVGDKVRAFRMIGCRVVAFEPQDSCVGILRRKFYKDDDVTIMPIGLTDQPGQLKLRLATDSQLASFSDEFVSHAQSRGRFHGASWKQTTTVCVSTLDQQIEHFGVPDFIKIDVEGFEPLVLRGLSRSVDQLCFEWTPERTAPTKECVKRCVELGLTEFNISINETSTLNFREWVSPEKIMSLTALLAHNVSMFGDIYARRATR